MLSRNQIKHLHALKLSRFREEYGEFIAEGDKIAGELLHSDYEVTGIYALPGWVSRQGDLLRERSSLVYELSESELGRISLLTTPNEVLVTARIPQSQAVNEIFGGTVLMLDKIQDPGNLGTIIRTADWFGIRIIVCSEGTADLYNPKVIQATMGSFTRVRVVYMDLQEVLGSLPAGMQVYGSYTGGESVYQFSPDPVSVLIIGNESRGISSKLEPFITRKIAIPSAKPGAESLNAAVAAGILLYEFKRPRQ
jgi:TrmH family RNA methyltransferase